VEDLSLVNPLGWERNLYVPTRNLNWYINGYESYTSTLFKQFCTSSDVIVDIGAHVGYYSLLAAQTNPKARIISIEASPENADVLRKNLSMNSFSVEVFNNVFSDQLGFTEFSLTEASDNCAVGGHQNSPTIQTIMVENLVFEQLTIEYDKRILVKIDIEGLEYSAILSLENFIKNTPDITLIVEYNPEALKRQISSPYLLFDKLFELGFRLFAICDYQKSWTELTKENYDSPTLINHMGYVNVVSIRSLGKVTLSGVVHSSGLAGGERDYLELVEGLVALKFMVHSILPFPDQGLGKELSAVGSSVTFADNLHWWVNVWDQETQNESDPVFWERYTSVPITRALQLVNADLILSTSVVIPQGAISAALLLKPHIWWLQEFGDIDHGMRLYLQPIQLGEVIYSLSDRVLCVSNAVKSHYFANADENILVVYPQPKIGLNAEGNLEREFTIGVAGTISPGKGQEDVIDALLILKSNGIKARLNLYGNLGMNGLEYKSTLEYKIRIYGLTEQVSFVGFENDRSKMYSEIDLLVVTSRNEAFGRTPIEASIFGVAVVYANSAGIGEYMKPEITGLPYVPGDEFGLAHEISRIISNQNFRFNLVKGSREYFEALTIQNPIGSILKKVFSEIEFTNKSQQVLDAITIAVENTKIPN